MSTWCDPKGMASGLEEAFGPKFEREGLDVKEFFGRLRKDGKYHVHVC